MTNKELLHLMQTKNADQEFLNELHEELTIELNKPESEQNFDLIDDLMQTIAMMNGTETLLEHRSEKVLKLFKHHLSFQKSNARKKHRILTAICACMAFLILSNVWSYSALGINAFSAAVKILNGSVVIDLKEAPESIDTPDNVFADEMKDECTNCSIEALLPSFIPSGFELKNIQHDQDEISTNVRFRLVCGDKKINFYITKYSDIENIPPIQIPADESHITQEALQNKTIYKVKEDNQFKVAFLDNSIQYYLSTYGLDYDESQRILESIFQD